jgi:hypothetical protein
MPGLLVSNCGCRSAWVTIFGTSLRLDWIAASDGGISEVTLSQVFSDLESPIPNLEHQSALAFTDKNIAEGCPKSAVGDSRSLVRVPAEWLRSLGTGHRVWL